MLRYNQIISEKSLLHLFSSRSSKGATADKLSEQVSLADVALAKTGGEKK